MKEIKFRAWHPELQQMFFDCHVSSESWRNNNMHFGGTHQTLMQYTGLKDKNGKEIYEGDVVNGTEDYPNYEDKFNKNEVVSWDDSLAGFYPFCAYDRDCGTYWQTGRCKIVGNIYENPELVEVAR
jgi:uncharacterized phage protein (TIGR01671 family)